MRMEKSTEYALRVKLYEKKCADGRHHDIHDIVADQDGGDQFVVVFGQLKCQCCPFVSIVRQHPFRRGLFRDENAVFHAKGMAASF